MSFAYEKDFKTEAIYGTSRSVAVGRMGAGDWWDRTGLVTSVVCIIHCLATPFALILLPATGSWLASPLVHQFLAIGVIAAAAGSLAPGYMQHWRVSVLLPALLGMATVLYAAFGTVCCGAGEMYLAGMSAGSVWSILGGFCLIAAHWNNLRAVRPCACH